MTSSNSKQHDMQNTVEVDDKDQARRDAIGRGVRRTNLAKAIRRQAIEDGHVPQPVQLEPIRYGTKWIYDIRFDDVGWWRYIMADDIDVMMEYRTKDIALAEYFKPAQVADLVALIRGRVYSIKARGYIPVWEVVHTSWLITKGIQATDIMTSAEEFTKSQIAIAKLELKVMQSKYESQAALTNAYKQQLKNLDLDIQYIAEGYAKRMFATLHKGEPKTKYHFRLLHRFVSAVKRHKLIVLGCIVLATLLLIILWM